MDADLDLLLIAVYCMADDFLPARPGNARRRISDAEVITLCVAQAMMGVPCDERFLRAARRRLGHLFSHLPERTAFHKRRLRLSGVMEALIREFARHSPGFYDGLLLVDSTPVECARSRETPQPIPHPLHRLKPWHYSSSVGPGQVGRLRLVPETVVPGSLGQSTRRTSPDTPLGRCAPADSG